jgi:hypothetical protein
MPAGTGVTVEGRGRRPRLQGWSLAWVAFVRSAGLQTCTGVAGLESPAEQHVWRRALQEVTVQGRGWGWRRFQACADGL